MNIKIDYDGTYPNLCSGKLIVTIDDKVWEFPDYCMSSGGGLDDDWCAYEGKWHIDTDKWPEDFPEEYKDKVLERINEEIEHGCCGGCA